MKFITFKILKLILKVYIIKIERKIIVIDSKENIVLKKLS